VTETQRPPTIGADSLLIRRLANRNCIVDLAGREKKFSDLLRALRAASI
jgi:hypothetical protein